MNDCTQDDLVRLVHFSNEFPHGDLKTLLRRLNAHSKRKEHTTLARLFEEATSAIRQEIKDLPQALQRLIPTFEFIHDLANHDELRRGRLGGSIDGVLLCIVQIGALIGYCEKLSRDDMFAQLKTSTLTGIGIGLLASTSLSVASKFEDLPVVGAQISRIAFRLGDLVAKVSENIQPFGEGNESGSWAYAVRGVASNEAQRELDEEYLQQPTVLTSKIFISGIGTDSVTLSGPPSKLVHLFRTNRFFRNLESMPLPVFGGLCHAAHIYTKKDAVSLVESLVIDPLSAPTSRILSPSTGAPFLDTSALQLLQEVVKELLTEPIIWNKAIHSIRQSVTGSIQLLGYSWSQPLKELKDALQPVASSEFVDLVSWAREIPRNVDISKSLGQSKIAIVGISCRFPGGASNTEAFWQILEEGLDVHRKVPADRFNVESHFDPKGKNLNASHTPYGCFIDNPGFFDAGFFNMSPHEVEQTDPMQRLALVTAYEALERAGFVLNRTPASSTHRVGTWYGQASDDYREVNTAQEIGTYFIPGGCRAFGPGRINYFFKFGGPSYSIDTACSSSLAAVQIACTSLWRNEVDTAIAGGMNILTNSDAFAGLSSGYFLTKTPNACKTWDVNADGYCRGEGVASIVLKRFEDAVDDNDNIYGLILGTGTNHSANAVSITHPDAAAQSFLYQQTLDRAGVDPLDVSYVEMHGTGTQAGDIQEMTSVTNVFAPLVPTKQRSVTLPLTIGSVKSNLGHGEASAGVTALLKVLLMFEKNMVPRHIGIKTRLNPKLSSILDRRNVSIPLNERSWARDIEKPRIAMINSFSAAGGNTTLLLEEPPEVPFRTMHKFRTSHIITLSAKTKISLKGNIQRLYDFLERYPSICIADLAYTTSARRLHYEQRVALHARSINQLQEQLSASLNQVDAQKSSPKHPLPPVAFIFTGQGAANKSLNLELFWYDSVFKSQVISLDALAQKLGFPSFIPMVDGSCNLSHDHGPVVTQIGLVCLEIALARYWDALGVKPEVVLGHSLGEYAALCVAGVLSASDAIYLVGMRARMLETKCQAGTHIMLAVNESVDNIQSILEPLQLPFEVSCINAPGATVLSGSRQQMQDVATLLEARGYDSTVLNLDYAFHSTQTDPILDEFEKLAQSISFGPPRIPVVSPLDGKVICDDKSINGTYLRRTTRETCNYLTALETMSSMSIVDKNTLWVEIGPHPVCSSFVKSTLGTPCTTLPTLHRKENNWATLGQSLGILYASGLNIQWAEFHKGFDVRLLDLPTYQWTETNYWIPYNGDWALTKGNNFYGSRTSPEVGHESSSSCRTTLVHKVIKADLQGTAGSITMRSNILSPEFLRAIRGHEMNGCAVITSSIYADIAYTLAEHLTERLGHPKSSFDMNLTNLEVIQGLVAKENHDGPQIVHVTAKTNNIMDHINVAYFNANDNGLVESEPFATVRVLFFPASTARASWTALNHLIESRIEALETMAMKGLASRFSQSMAYSLFASSLVRYSNHYRGMQSVVMHDHEAFAEVTLSTETVGTWTVPPHFIDSVAHLAGFVMNVSDSHDMTKEFCVTPGWQGMRITETLEPGSRYRSYVKMIRTPDDQRTFLGDVYVLKDGHIIGLVGGIRFRQYPRILLNKFFPIPGSSTVRSTAPGPLDISHKWTAPTDLDSSDTVNDFTDGSLLKSNSSIESSVGLSTGTSFDTDKDLEKDSPTIFNSESTSSQAVTLIATQTGIEVKELTNETLFADIGVDSLMGLVITERFKNELGIAVSSGIFLEYQDVGSLKSWIEMHHG